MIFLPYILAFAITLYISINDLYNKNTILTFDFTKKSFWLWVYGFIYGAISIAFLFMITQNFIIISINNSSATTSIPQKANIWIYALFVGISARSILNVSFYNISLDGKVFPIGLATITQLFEPWLERCVEDDYFINLDNFLDEKVTTYSTLSVQQIHARMRSALIPRKSKPEVNAFLLQLAGTTDAKEAFRMYAVEFGKKTFLHSFK